MAEAGRTKSTPYYRAKLAARPRGTILYHAGTGTWLVGTGTMYSSSIYTSIYQILGWY